MNSQIRIERSENFQETEVEVSGSMAFLSFKVRSRLGPRQRRAMALAFFRRIRPFLEYFSHANVWHSNASSASFKQNEERGLNVFASSDFPSATGNLGFEIRILRLEKGWNQQELARVARISRCHLSRVERGLIRPRRATLRQIEQALGAELRTLGPEASAIAGRLSGEGAFAVSGKVPKVESVHAIKIPHKDLET
jgi:DNA-binding XRE family transcriptional regulator